MATGPAGKPLFKNWLLLHEAKDLDALIENGEDPNAHDYLRQAVKEGFKEKVDVLLRHGADASTVDKEGLTVLHVCAINSRHRPDVNYADMVQGLVASGADVNALETHGFTALAHADSLPMAKALCDNGASVLVGARARMFDSGINKPAEVVQFLKERESTELAALSKQDLFANLDKAFVGVEPEQQRQTRQRRM